jgi:cytoskeletal protein RodZ
MKSDRLNLKQIQVEQLATIGAALRQAREEQQLSLEQMAAKTLVQRRLLAAIEAGDLDQLPELIYVRGFVKRYADVLGLEGENLSELLPSEPTHQGMKPSWKELPAAQLRPLHLYILYILLIAGSVSGLSYWLKQTAVETAVSPTVNVPAATEPEPKSATTPASSPRPAPAATTAPAPASPRSEAQPIRVEVTLTSQSWMRIVIDGDTEFEGVLQEGEQRTWTAEQQLTIRAGNAGGVMVAYNEQNAKQLGAPGSVEEVTFSESQSTAQLAPTIAASTPLD